MAAGDSLTRAMLTIYEPPIGDSDKPGAKITSVRFQFNPSQLSLTRRTTWKATTSVGVRDGVKPEFMGPEPRTMSVDIFLDKSDKPTSNDVETAVKTLFSCCEVTARSLEAKQPSTPWVKFTWGSSTVSFNAYVSEVTANYTLFNSTGKPIRANCQVHLNEIPAKTGGQNPTSGALTARRVHRVISGDSLQSLAWSEYGDATAWRILAETNNIDDPSQLVPGTQLMLPAAEEVSHG